MTNIKTIKNKEDLTSIEKDILINFLFNHLEEFGDTKEDIEKCIDYAFSNEGGKGGFILVGYNQSEVVSVLIMNNTGMKGYIPENILVYIATHNQHRGKGIGKAMIKKAFEVTNGNIALHVEPNNPAKYLYQKLGFTNKYLEMRYQNNN